jgi:hypothetical protein
MDFTLCKSSHDRERSTLIDSQSDPRSRIFLDDHVNNSRLAFISRVRRQTCRGPSILSILALGTFHEAVDPLPPISHSIEPWSHANPLLLPTWRPAPTYHSTELGTTQAASYHCCQPDWRTVRLYSASSPSSYGRRSYNISR